MRDTDPTRQHMARRIARDEAERIYATSLMDDQEMRLAIALREAEAALYAIHEYQCGCDHPGRTDLCIAKPSHAFEAL